MVDNRCDPPSDRVGGGRPAGAMVTAVAILCLAACPALAKYSGGSGTPDDPYQINTLRDLLSLATAPNDWGGHFRLTDDIDMAEAPRDAACVIGDELMPFRGTFDGAGRSILHFTCATTGRDRVGFFGHIRGSQAEVRDLCLIDPNVDGGTGTGIGALVGHLGTGTVTGCRVEGARVRGAMAVGGLVGWTYATIRGCTAEAQVVGNYSVGGLVGVCAPDADIRDCSADASVTGINRVGGLVGGATLATIHWSSAAGRASGSWNVGGLVGISEGAAIDNCYARTCVTGSSPVAGLVAYSGFSCDCSTRLPSVIRCCYSTGRVVGDADAGGLIAYNEPDCTVDQCFWDTQTSGVTTSAEGTALTTGELQMRQTFAVAWWDFTPKPDSGDYWVIRCEPQYPRPAWQMLDGDLDSDGDVDLCDFSALALSWSQPAASFETGGADLTGDEYVDTQDLLALCRNWLARNP